MSELILHFLNVGKGNCTVVNFPLGRLGVIDIDDSRSLSPLQRVFMGGRTLTDPIDYILSNFPNKEIFRFILTHPDMDHMSGIKELFDKKNVFNFWDTANNKHIATTDWSNSTYDKADWDFYQELRKKKENPIVLRLNRGAKADCCWIQDGMEVLAPTPGLAKEANKSEEYDHISYVLMVRHAGKKVLLGGDASKKVWDDIISHYGANYIKADVFLAPNHGSRNHISRDILNAVNPELTVVSVAEGVDYADDLYRDYGKVLSTKHYGNIWVGILDNGEIYYQTQLHEYRGQWHGPI